MTAAPSTTSPARESALVGILEAQHGVFRELIELTREQRRALLDTEVEQLETLNAKAETLATRFRMLEDERRRLMERGQQIGSNAEQSLDALKETLKVLLREGAVSEMVLDRLADTVAARQGAVASLFGSTYLADGSQAGLRVQGSALSAEG